MISRRRWLAAVGASFVAGNIGCDRSKTTTERAEDVQPLDRALDWLVAKQQGDGSWRSEHYAPLRSGFAVTPLVRLAVEPCLQTSAGLIRCPGQHLRPLWWIRSRVSPDGVVGFDDPELPEYPNYATSLAVRCLVADEVDADRPLIARMVKYLVEQQYCEATGFEPEHVCYGGWGFGGVRPTGTSPGHMDIGHTRHVLEALRAAGHDDPQTYARAERFLDRMQKRNTPAFDGGFYFSPIVTAANKGGETIIDGTTYYNSYATCTCDGVLALLACGVKRDDERIAAADEWLKKHPRLDFPEGVLEGTDTNWGTSIRFYHFAARAECYAALDRPGEWRSELRAILEKLQQPDGSFVNREGFLMKEDDPILCTALAVMALAKTMNDE